MNFIGLLFRLCVSRLTADYVSNDTSVSIPSLKWNIEILFFMFIIEITKLCFFLEIKV